MCLQHTDHCFVLVFLPHSASEAMPTIVSIYYEVLIMLVAVCGGYIADAINMVLARWCLVGCC